MCIVRGEDGDGGVGGWRPLVYLYSCLRPRKVPVRRRKKSTDLEVLFGGNRTVS